VPVSCDWLLLSAGAQVSIAVVTDRHGRHCDGGRGEIVACSAGTATITMTSSVASRDQNERAARGLGD